MLIGLESLGIPAVVTALPLVVLTFAAARRQGAVSPLPLADLVRHVGVGPAAMTRPGTCTEVASALAVCRRCALSDLCRRRLSSGREDEVVQFCPNAALVRRLAGQP